MSKCIAPVTSQILDVFAVFLVNLELSLFQLIVMGSFQAEKDCFNKYTLPLKSEAKRIR
jgi:hypothetical protein